MSRELPVHRIGGGAEPASGGPAAFGFKAWNLARLDRLGVPVPPAFVLDTAWCRDYAAHGCLPPDIADRLQSALRHVESASGFAFGGARRPLLVSVRSGAPVSMPGMMDTVLDVGLCDATVPGLLRATGNPRLVWDSYRRLVESFGTVVAGVDAGVFTAATRALLAAHGSGTVGELDFRGLRQLARALLAAYEAAAGEPFPQAPLVQLERAVEAVLRSWDAPKARWWREARGIDGAHGTAVTVQQMVFGNAGGTSGAGVGFTRDPATGAPGPYLDYVANAQGEDVVSGRVAIDASGALERLPGAVAEELAELARLLELEFGDAQEFEFTVQDGRLHVLQTRDAKRTPLAGLRILVELAEAGLVDVETARARAARPPLADARVDRLIGVDALAPLACGVPAGVGVAAGRLALDVAQARAYTLAGEAAILARNELTTDDVAGIEAAAGVVAARGARTSHAAVVARQLGRPCVVGCAGLDVDAAQGHAVFGTRRLPAGAAVTLDANTGTVYEGLGRVASTPPTEWLERLARLARLDEPARASTRPPTRPVRPTP